MAATNANFLQRATQSAWVRPVLFLVLLIVLWDVAIRIFRIPPYQIPKPADVLLTLWTEGPQLLQQAVPTTIATVQGFLLSAVFGIGIAVLIAGSRTVESYVYPLLVFSQSIPKIAIAPLFVVWFGFWHDAEGALGLPAGILPCCRVCSSGLQIGRTRNARPRPRDGS